MSEHSPLCHCDACIENRQEPQHCGPTSEPDEERLIRMARQISEAKTVAFEKSIRLDALHTAVREIAVRMDAFGTTYGSVLALFAEELHVVVTKSQGASGGKYPWLSTVSKLQEWLKPQRDAAIKKVQDACTHDWNEGNMICRRCNVFAGDLGQDT